jgi:hypothetical protein
VIYNSHFVFRKMFCLIHTGSDYLAFICSCGFLILHEMEYLAVSPIVLLIFLFTNVSNGRQFDSIDLCKDRVEALQQTSPELGLTFLLTLPQCYEYCGEGFGGYEIWDVIGALTGWVIPLFLLIGNLNSPRTSSRRLKCYGHDLGCLNFLAVVTHLLANPIDFIWSQATKLDAGRRIWNRCEAISGLSPRQKLDLSTICFALDDFNFGDRVDELIETARKLGQPATTGAESKELADIRAGKFEIIAQVGQELADTRGHNFRRAMLAILTYCAAVFTALIESRSTQQFPYHMPHTLALREEYYWLLLAVILSAAAGGFPSHRTSRFLLRRLWAGLELREPDLPPIDPWTGGNYSWRFRKDLSRAPRTVGGRVVSRGGDARWALLLLLSVLPVLMAATWAFLISWYTPTVGLGGRGLAELAFLLTWLVNWIVTLGVGRLMGELRVFAFFIFSRVKDSVLSLFMLYVLFGAFQGKQSSLSLPSYMIHELTHAFDL